MSVARDDKTAFDLNDDGHVIATKYNAVPGCPRVEVLAIDYDKAAVRSDEAEPGHALLIVPVSDLSSFEERDELAEAGAMSTSDGLGAQGR